MFPSTINQTRSRHLAHTIGILISMAALLGLLGYLLSGPTGLIMTVFMVGAGSFFAPRFPSRLIMRLYGARLLQPYEAPRLYRILVQLARNAGLDNTPKLYYTPHRTMNAFAAGTTDDPAIAVTRGLISLLSESEIAGILGHEISHIKNNDTGMMAFAGLLHRLTHAAASLGLIFTVFMLPLVLAGKAQIAISSLLIIILAPTLSALLQLALSRTREFEADLGSAMILGSPYPLAKALHTLQSVQKKWYPFIFPASLSRPPELFSTHPDTGDRIQRLMSLATHPGRNGKRAPYMVSRPILIPMDSAQ